MTEEHLSVPEGYFEQSFQKTMQMANRERRRRKHIILTCMAVVVVLVGIFAASQAVIRAEYNEYLAEQAALGSLDVFMEIN